MPVLQLKGCHYEPLGDYLKALGIFRLIAEQLDPTARCWWKDGIFHLWLNGDAYYPLDGCTCKIPSDQASEAERQAWLQEWFLNSVEISPFLLPWQSRSGFFSQKGEAAKLICKDTHQLQKLAQTMVDLSHVYEQPVQAARQWFEKDRDEGNTQKNDLIRLIRNLVRNPSMIQFCDALATFRKNPKQADNPTWQPFMGKAGAAESSGHSGTAWLKALEKCFQSPGSKSKEASSSSLFDNNFPILEDEFSLGIFWPVGKDDPNLAQNLKGGRLGNPWNVVFLFEALPFLAGSLSRKISAKKAVPTFPFFTTATLGGHPSLSTDDDREGASPCKGELWMPIWNRPASPADLETLFSEGRIGTHGTKLNRGRDFVSALSRFGARKGIASFSRFGVFDRSGSGTQTTRIAAYLGYYVAKFNAEFSLLQSLDDFGSSVDQRVTKKNTETKPRIKKAAQAFLDAYMEAHQLPSRDAQENRLRSFQVLVAASRFEREMEKTEGKLESDKPAIREFCLPSLKQDWLWLKKDKTEDKRRAFYLNSPAFRLARALGCIQAWPPRSEAQDSKEPPRVGPIRENTSAVLPKDGYSKSHYWKWDWPKEGSKANRCVWRHGLPFLTNCAAVLKRRMADADPAPNSPLPLWSGFGATLSDIAALWSGDLDESELTDQHFAFSLIRGHDTAQNTDARQKKDDPTIQIADAMHAFEDENGIIHSNRKCPMRNGKPAVSNEDTEAAFALPRAYALLKLCFMGGRLPPLAPAKGCRERTGHEPYPPGTLAILNLLLAGRGIEAVNLAARQLRARGYPTIHDPHGGSRMETLSLEDWRRLAGLLLIPTHQTGALASLVIKPNIER